MGKNTGSKKRASEANSQPLATFFSPANPGVNKASNGKAEDKMASPTSETGLDHVDPITRSDLRAEFAPCFSRLEATMSEKITVLMALLTAQCKNCAKQLIKWPRQ